MVYCIFANSAKEHNLATLSTAQLSLSGSQQTFYARSLYLTNHICLLARVAQFPSSVELVKRFLDLLVVGRRHQSFVLIHTPCAIEEALN